MKIKNIIIMFLIGFFAIFGWSQETKQTYWGKKWKEADGNGDGIVTLTEATKKNLPAVLINKVNKDKNSEISKKEFKKINRQIKKATRSIDEKYFRLMDDNKDRRVSMEEWWGKEIHFVRADLNKDGFIALDESKRINEEWVEKSKEIKKFKKLDRDKSGKLTSAEWKERKELFGILDKNGDGTLSKKEFLYKGTRK